ncbi:MAG: KR domain-containing protein, partial [Candidatus Aminicenantes bacterium]
PKIKGAWNLHTLTSNESLDFFVLFSSGASVLGAPGQGNYSAANAFLDILAHYRKAGGKPALSINWGPWAGIGMAAKFDPDGRLAIQGFGSIEPTRRMELLGRLLCQESAQVIAMPINWQQWNKFYSGFGRYALISQLEYAHGGPDSSTSSTEMRHTLLAAEPEKRQQLLEEHFRGQVAEVLGFQVSKLDILQPLNNMGIDSLMAVELKNRIEIELGIVLPLVKFLQGPSIAQLAAQMLEQLVAATSSPSPSPGPVDTPHQDSAEESEQLIAKINELSEKEVDMLLRDMLAAEEDSE